MSGNCLVREKKWLLQFVMNPNVKPTNNRAERGLMPLVIYRKVSGGSQSERRSEIYTRIFSIYNTSKLRGNNSIADTIPIIKRKARSRYMIRNIRLTSYFISLMILTKLW